MENVELINFVLKRFQNMVLIMFMFAVHVSQMVGGVHKIVNASQIIAGVATTQMILLGILLKMENALNGANHPKLKVAA